MKTKIYSIAAILTLSVSAWSQGVGVNETGANPDPSAILDVSSTTKGVLTPRMTTAQRNTITDPAKGLTIFNLDDNLMQINTGTPASPVWQAISPGAQGAQGPAGAQGAQGAPGPAGLLPNGTVTGNTPYWNGSSWVVNSNNIYNNGGNIGIGNTSPNGRLSFANETINRKIVLWDGGADDNQFYGFGVNPSVLRYQVSGAVANHIFYAGTGVTTSNELMRITGAGRVGIGGIDPSFPLDVNGSARIRGTNSLYLNGQTDAGTDGTRMLFSGGNSYFDSKGAGSIFFRNDNVNGATTRMTIANNGFVGIGTIAPTQALHVAGNAILNTNYIGDVGRLELGIYGSGDRTSYIDFHAQDNVNYNVRLVRNTGQNGHFVLQNTGTGRIVFRQDANGKELIIDGSGNVRINANQESTFELRVGGAISCVSLVQTSDERAKSNIQRINYGLETVMKLRPVSYDLHDADLEDGRVVRSEETEKSMGMIAQEMYQIVPEAVFKPADESKELWAINYTELIPIMIKAIQEQQAQIEAQQAQIAALQNTNNQLTAEQQVLKSMQEKLAALEKLIQSQSGNDGSQSVVTASAE